MLSVSMFLKIHAGYFLHKIYFFDQWSHCSQLKNVSQDNWSNSITSIVIAFYDSHRQFLKKFLGSFSMFDAFQVWHISRPKTLRSWNCVWNWCSSKIVTSLPWILVPGVSNTKRFKVIWASESLKCLFCIVLEIMIGSKKW